MSKVIPKELAAARFIAANKRPYLALALFALTPIVRHGLETMAVDSKYRLYYDPVVLVKWNREQVAAVLLHEVGHILRKHSIRGQKINANSELWNQANDAEINDDLLDEGLDLPGNPITPSSLKVGIGNGRLAEEYYFALLKQQEQSNNQQQQSQQNQQQNQQNQSQQQLNTNSQSQQSSSQGLQSSQGQQQQNQQAQSSGSTSQSQEQGSLQSKHSSSSSSPNTNSNSKAQEQNGQAQGSNNTPTPDSKGNNPQLNSGNNSQQSTTLGSKEKPSPGSGRCGSCATGIKEDYEADELEAPGLNSIEQLALEEKVAKQILKANENRGRVAAGWVRWASQKVKPKADWQRQLASLINASLRMTSGANDYSYSRPNRRQSVYGNVVMPSLVKPVPNIAIVVDTSGSLTDQMMSQALAEIETILKRTGQKLHLISCDSKVHFNKKISSIKEAKLLGGGGTDMRVGIKQALETKPKPDVIIVITDGYTPWPSQPPKKTKIIAALTRSKIVPSWIRTVKLFD